MPSKQPCIIYRPPACACLRAIIERLGAVAVKFGEDKRVGWFYVPEKYRPQPGVVDYGFCAVRFGDAVKLTEKIPKN